MKYENDHNHNHNHPELSNIAWRIIQFAALVFAVTSVALYISSQLTGEKDKITSQPLIPAFVHSEKPKPESLVEFDTPEALLYSEKDLALLPKGIDESFTEQVRTILKANQPDELQCVQAYSLVRYSNVNIQLSEEVVNAETLQAGGNCGGGGLRTFSLIANDWTETPFIGQTAIRCEEIEKYGLFNEFSGQCFDEAEMLVDNPLGNLVDFTL